MSAVYTEASITALNSLLHLPDSDALVASTAVLRMQERRLRMFIGEADGMAASDPKQTFVHCLGLLDSLPFKAGGASD